ncbi:MAG TPA: hypothetical protein DCY91_16020 [Cyanobacteria bacterium UBA11370]|nr:hypothetical protein [Cyanobacteria bacterium UBA11370]HBY78764.1 hypothetical protein [Cyanobacteria bacterium UBA11148]
MLNFILDKTPNSTLTKIATFSLLSLFVSTHSAQAASLAKGNWDIVNNTGQNANDFHIVVSSDSCLTLQNHFDGVFRRFTPQTTISCPQPGIEHIRSYRWDQGAVPNGGKTHVGLTFSQEIRNKINILDAYWTNDGNRLGKPLTLPGFEVTPFGSPVGSSTPSRLRIFNDLSDPIFVNNFSYSINDFETPLPILMFNDSGLTTSVSDFSVGANSFFDVFVDLPIASGDFLVFQGQACEDVNCTTVNGNFVYEHEHTPIPEPSTVISFLGLAVFVLNKKGLSKIREFNNFKR